MSLEDFTNTVREKVGEDSGLDATIKFAFTDGGILFIDGKSTPNRVSNEDEDAQCTVKVSSEDFGKLLRRELDPMTAFMGGKIKIVGNAQIPMALSGVFV